MRRVVDASVAIKWLVSEENSNAADRLLAGGDDLHAPWRSKAWMGEIGRGRDGILIAALSEMPV